MTKKELEIRLQLAERTINELTSLLNNESIENESKQCNYNDDGREKYYASYVIINAAMLKIEKYIEEIEDIKEYGLSFVSKVYNVM